MHLQQAQPLLREPTRPLMIAPGINGSTCVEAITATRVPASKADVAKRLVDQAVVVKGDYDVTGVQATDKRVVPSTSLAAKGRSEERGDNPEEPFLCPTVPSLPALTFLTNFGHVLVVKVDLRLEGLH